MYLYLWLLTVNIFIAFVLNGVFLGLKKVQSNTYHNYDFVLELPFYWAALACWLCVSFSFPRLLWSYYTFVPRHDKTNIMGLLPAWIQTSLRIRTVWSKDPCCSLSVSLRAIGFVSEQHGSWSDCAGWSGSMLVANPWCWFCHGAAHLSFKNWWNVAILT
jgi:hypothetical protein